MKRKRERQGSRIIPPDLPPPIADAADITWTCSHGMVSRQPLYGYIQAQVDSPPGRSMFLVSCGNYRNCRLTLSEAEATRAGLKAGDQVALDLCYGVQPRYDSAGYTSHYVVKKAWADRRENVRACLRSTGR